MIHFFDIESFKNMSETIIVSKVEYEQFKKEFVFEKLKGKRFGESFCEKFGVSSPVLSIMKNEEETDFLIQTLGYIK
jgi:hypothetical protein